MNILDEQQLRAGIKSGINDALDLCQPQGHDPEPVMLANVSDAVQRFGGDNFRAPTLADVNAARQLATGHSDFAPTMTHELMKALVIKHTAGGQQ